MMKCKVLGSITTRENGIRKVYTKGDSVILSPEEASRLVKEKVVEVIDTIDVAPDDAPLDAKALKKMNKEELIQYGLEIGLELSKDMKNPDIVNAIVDYLEEKESLGE